MLHCELFPLLPAAIECSLLRRPYLYDFDDALYLKYRQGRMAWLSPLLGQKFERLVAGAAAVSAGNQVLAEFARPHNAVTECLPTVVDTGRFRPVPRPAASAPFTIGWIGSPATNLYLQALVAPLTRLAHEAPLRLRVVGGTAPAIPGVEVESLPWEAASEVALINSFDVGVMPLSDDAWARGKCAFKLIQYMACGVPVIASPVGANCEVVTPDCGLLAADEAGWCAALRQLRDDPALRQRMGAAARARIESHYSLASNLPRLAALLRQVAGRAG